MMNDAPRGLAGWLPAAMVQERLLMLLRRMIATSMDDVSKGSVLVLNAMTKTRTTM